jgi:hypothetical protein
LVRLVVTETLAVVVASELTQLVMVLQDLL